MSNEELGWFEQCSWVKNAGWDIEIQFENYTDIENMGLLSKIQQSANPRRYSEKCMVNLPQVYQELNVLIPDEEELLPEEDNITKELQTIRDACTSIIGSLSRLDKILNN